jgi:hypothetical protein
VSANSGAAASSLLAPLVDGPVRPLHVVHRSSSAWHLADPRGRVVLSVITRAAVRLPHAAVVAALPGGSSPISAGGGSLEWDGVRTAVTRWFRPARPTLPSLYAHLDSAAVDAFARRWPASIGRGDGLTPYHDDVLCGGLVALSAAGHPAAAAIADDLGRSPLERQTTAVSAALLRHATRGYCIDPLARFLATLAADLASPGRELSAHAAGARAALEAVGHSSGRGLVEGVERLVGPRASRLHAA